MLTSNILGLRFCIIVIQNCAKIVTTKTYKCKMVLLNLSPGTDGVAVDVHNGLLPHVDPDDLAILGPPFADLLTSLQETLLGGLTTAEDFVAGDATEVGDSFNFVFQLLDFFKVISHSHFAPYFGILSFVTHDV